MLEGLGPNMEMQVSNLSTIMVYIDLKRALNTSCLSMIWLQIESNRFFPLVKVNVTNVLAYLIS